MPKPGIDLSPLAEFRLPPKSRSDLHCHTSVATSDLCCHIRPLLTNADQRFPSPGVSNPKLRKMASRSATRPALDAVRRIASRSGAAGLRSYRAEALQLGRPIVTAPRLAPLRVNVRRYSQKAETKKWAFEDVRSVTLRQWLLAAAR